MSRKNPGPYSIGSTTWPGLSKVIEECGELQQVAGKLIATGGNPHHYDGSNLTDRLTQELGDVLAAISYFVEANDLQSPVRSRRLRKLKRFRKWHEEQR